MRGFSKFCAVLARFLGILSLLVVVGATLGYGFGLLPLMPAFLGVVGAMFGGLLAVVLGFIAFVMGGRYESRFRRLGLAGMLFGALAAAVPAYWYLEARGVPVIHDISTDTTAPPEFVEVAPLRADASNPVEYAGIETARLQSEAYPDIQTIEFPGTKQQAFDKSLAIVEAEGWDLVGSDLATGRIEATDTTLFFRFKDDIVIRIVANGDSARVDVRSKSRVGESDLAVNANRIRAFRDSLLSSG